MEFDPTAYGVTVAGILALDGGGERLMPLAGGSCCSAEAGRRLRESGPDQLFPASRAPEAAMSGLWLYFSCLDESHSLSQGIHTPEGSFWHGIMHRQEPDAWNSGYWFRRVGSHPVYPRLAEEAARLAAEFPAVGFLPGAGWDPAAFIDFVEQARKRPGSQAEQLALRIQRAEWQILFDYCAGVAR
ncbi:MAG: hypothetical protein SFV51_08330 [Bryobacteraceae bacterium]|nr:hypothetical protein [Bryobacteraceae bacterium]